MASATLHRSSPITIITCGLAFSGKSTAARKVTMVLGADLISLDAIMAERGLDGQGGLPVAEWERTSHIAMNRLAAALQAGRSAVVDDTFSHRFLRDRCRSVAAEAGARFTMLYVDTPIDVITARRAENRRTPTRPDLQDDVFATHRDGFQHPQDDEVFVRITDDATLDAFLDLLRNRG